MSKRGSDFGYQDIDHVHAVTHLGGFPLYSYDDNGNMSSRAHNGSSYQQTFDFENRLVEVSDGAALVAEMTYDADGARIWQKAGLTTTVYINDLMEKAFC